MRRQRSLAFIIAIALTASSTSAAERWRDKLPERKLYMPITVLLLNDVKTELKLTREQEQEIAKITEEAKKDVAIKYKELRDEGVDILRSDEPVRLLQAMAEIDYPATNRAYELLDESQQQRAVEITLQQAGVVALQYGDLAKQLELTDEQRDRIDAVFAKCAGEIRAAVQLRGEEFQAATKRAKLARRDNTEAVLTAEQRAKFKAMKGKHSPAGETDN
jgi:Spy/CpxP family protein refolding chaperone